MKLWIAVTLASLRLSGACVPVTGDKILARDFAAAVPGFAAADPEMTIGFAPLPGAERVFKVKETEAVARRAGSSLAVPEGDVCFVRVSHALEAEEIVKKLASILQISADKIELTDYSRGELPVGQMEFPLSGAARSAESVLWRGRLVAEGGRSFAIWARIKVAIETEVVTAVSALVRGQEIAAEQVTVVRMRRSPFESGFLNKAENAIGRVVKRDVAAGAVLQANLLEEPKQVKHGEMVLVEAVSGRAQISFEARAQTAGSKGEQILVQNPANGRTFRATVMEKGKVRAGSAGKT